VRIHLENIVRQPNKLKGLSVFVQEKCSGKGTNREGAKYAKEGEKKRNKKVDSPSKVALPEY
jgi:hypothetical protein